MKGLGFQGTLALRESKIHSGLLTSLDQAGKTAYQQRNTALFMMAQSIMAHDETRQSAEEIGHGIRRDIQQGNTALFQIDRGIQTTNRSLISMDYGIGRSNRLLSSIDMGVSGLGIQVENLESNLLSSLGELGNEISGLSKHVAQSTLQILDALGGFEDVFLWAHREKMALQRKILYVVQNPVSMQAMNIWTLGERARKVGDYNQAIALYQKSLVLHPLNLIS